MIRIQRRKHGRGVIIGGRALEDPNLSFRAKGLLAYLQAVPLEAGADMKDLENVSLEGKAAIKTALKELEDGGYLTRTGETETGTGGGNGGDEVVTHGAWMDGLFGDLSPLGVGDNRGTSQERQAPGTRIDEMRRSLQRIIDHLNRLRERSWDWAHYTPLSARYAKNVEHISGRLRDGYVEEDLILVLEYLAATDGGKEESRRYFNCATPFNTKNFESNLAMARDWKARGRGAAGRRAPGTSRGKEYYLGTAEEDG
jgi:uncharacterized phage protein (TIGR02220 family)